MLHKYRNIVCRSVSCDALRCFLLYFGFKSKSFGLHYLELGKKRVKEVLLLKEVFLLNALEDQESWPWPRPFKKCGYLNPQACVPWLPSLCLPLLFPLPHLPHSTVTLFLPPLPCLVSVYSCLRAFVLFFSFWRPHFASLFYRVNCCHSGLHTNISSVRPSLSKIQLRASSPSQSLPLFSIALNHLKLWSTFI